MSDTPNGMSQADALATCEAARRLGLLAHYMHDVGADPIREGWRVHIHTNVAGEGYLLEERTSEEQLEALIVAHAAKTGDDPREATWRHQGRADGPPARGGGAST